MARSNSWEVLWSPNNPNKFIRYNTSDVSSDVCLYQLYQNQVAVKVCMFHCKCDQELQASLHSRLVI